MIRKVECTNRTQENIGTTTDRADFELLSREAAYPLAKILI